MIGWVSKRTVFEHLHKRILQTANNNYGYVADAGVIISDLANRLQGWLNEMDIIDAVPVVHGRWIDEGQYGDNFPHHAWRCSECGEHVIEIDTSWYKYCPNCGADMRGEQDG